MSDLVDSEKAIYVLVEEAKASGGLLSIDTAPTLFFTQGRIDGVSKIKV